MISGQLVPIRRDLDLMYRRDFSPAARSAHLADTAAKAFAAADLLNLAITGMRLRSATFVDGREIVDLAGIKPDGIATRVYDLLPIAITDLGALLREYSPVKSGLYRDSHVLLADGVEYAKITEGWTCPQIPSSVRELVLINTTAYARLMEPVDGRSAWSSQAPDGVYHVLSEMAGPTYGALAKFSFGYRELAGTPESVKERRARPDAPRDLRQPCIIIQPL